MPSDRYQGQYAAQKLVDKGVNVTVLAHADNSYGQSLAFAFTAAYTRDGGRAYSVGIPPQGPNHNVSADVDKVLAEVAARKADGVYVASNQTGFIAALLKAVKAYGRKVAVFLSDSGMDPTVAAAAGASTMAGVRGSDVAFGDPSFVEAFKKYAKSRNATVSYVAKAAHAYDATAALVEAYRRAAGAKDGPAVLAELGGVKFSKAKSGVALSFDEYGDASYDPESSYEVSEFDSAGQIKPLGVKATARRSLVSHHSRHHA